MTKAACWTVPFRCRLGTHLCYQIEVLYRRIQVACTWSKDLLYEVPWIVLLYHFSPTDAKRKIENHAKNFWKDHGSKIHGLRFTYNVVWKNTCQTFSALSSLNFVVNGPRVWWDPGTLTSINGASEITIPSLVPCYLISWSNFFFALITRDFLPIRDALFGPFLVTTLIFASFQGGSFWIFKWFLWTFSCFSYFLLFCHAAISKLNFLEIFIFIWWDFV